MKKAIPDSTHRRLALRRSYVFMFVLILLASSVFANNHRNPFALIGTEPFFYILLLGATGTYFANGKARKLDVLILVLPFAAMALSAFLARINFGQPLVFGFGESRRCLGLLIYFPLASALRDRRSREVLWFILHSLIAIAVLASVLGLLWRLTGLHWYHVDFARFQEGIRSDRVIIGGQFLCFGVAACGACLRRRGFSPKILAALALMFAEIVFVQQTVQVLVASVLILVIFASYRQSAGSRLLIGIFVALVVLVAAPAVLSSKIGSLYATLLHNRTDASTLLSGSRAIAVMVGLDKLPHYWWGAGGLAFSWNGGFTTLWDVHFWLADIGVIGTIFRFGIFSLFFIPVMAYLILRRTVPDELPVRCFCVAITVMWILLSPVADWLMYRGALIGIFLAIKFAFPSVAERKRERVRGLAPPAVMDAGAAG